MLHELAREIRGVEKRRGKKMAVAQYKAISDKWESASKPFLRPGHDYFTDLLAKLDCVTVPKGETLKAAFERAKTKPPTAKVLIHQNTEVRLLASLCRELQEMAGDQAVHALPDERCALIWTLIASNYFQLDQSIEGTRYIKSGRAVELG